MNARTGICFGILMATAAAAYGQTGELGGPPFRLADGTTVQLRLQQTISSETAKVGDKVHFEVVNEIRVNRVPVILKGSGALGTVTAARPKRRLGRGGQLDVNIDSVRLANGEQAALRSTERAVGESNSAAVTGGVIATGVIFWPAAPAFLLMHGHEVTMPEGTEITAYVAGEMELAASEFPPPRDYGSTRAAIPAGTAPALPLPQAAPAAPAARRDATYPGYVVVK